MTNHQLRHGLDRFVLTLSLLAVAGAGCGSGTEEATPDGGGTAGASGSGGKTNTGGAGGGAGGGGGSTKAGDFGFTYRTVNDKQLDWLCTLHAVGANTYVYVRLDQTGTKSAGIATIPVYAASLAKVSANGTVSDAANAKYEFGGGHNIDTLRLDYQGKSYQYSHSSLGFGYRPCQDMDCVATPTTDGCTSARALPEVCVRIKADGTHDPLTDNFKKCPGDSGS